MRTRLLWVLAGLLVVLVPGVRPGGTAVAATPTNVAWAWGDNSAGQLGQGFVSSTHLTPVPVSNLSGLVAIAAGFMHSLALKGDGTVWAWGFNSNGQLGNGTSGNSASTPVPVSGLNGVVAIAGGSAHGLALKRDGTVWTWGRNEHGQLGNGTIATSGCLCSTTPVQVVNADGTPLSGAVAVAAGGFHSLALKGDGTVWAWGYDGSGALGDGGSTDSGRPVSVLGPDGTGSLTNVSAIAGGSFFSLALRSDHSVWAWGSNGSGQLGDGTTTDRHMPVPMTGLSGVVAVAGGGGYSVALTPPAVGLSLQPDAKQALWPTVFSQSSLTLDLQAVIPAQNLGDWTIDVIFDPAALQPTGCSFSKALSPVSECNLTYHAGRIRIAGAVGSKQALSGTVDLATVAFKVLAPPNSPISVRPRALALGDPAPEPLGGLLQTLSVTSTAAADVNRDGTVNTYDAACVLNDVATNGRPAGTPLCPANLPQSNYDVNQNGKVDATDALCVLLAVTGQKATKACPAFAVVGAEIPDAAPRAAEPAIVSTSRWASVRLTPRTSSAKQGENVTLTLEARAPAGIGAWTVDLRYDPTLVHVVSCDAGDGMAVCNPDLAANTIRITGASVAGQTSLTLATVSFRVTGAAWRTAALRVQAVTLDDPAGAALSAITSGAALHIKR